MNRASGGAVCRNCGRAPTIRAHLIPRAFAQDIRDGGPDLRVGSIDQTGYGLSKAGFFDDSILCACCDGKLGAFDSYAVTFCRTFEQNREMINGDMFRIAPVDTDRLVRFAVSVCWRYSISTRPEAANIQLGPFEDEFRQILYSGRRVSAEPALVIWANRTAFNMKRLAFAPTMHRQYGLRFCSIILSGLSFVLKIDHRPLPRKAKILAINGKDTIVSGYKPFDGSYEFHGMMKVVRNMDAPREKSHRSSRET